ncbi:hypothetical protein [Pseudooceanicola aestuarii]|uniref:hypothetical protein n=1 Tax=Pseudooceanicola aestuarii TaxID=2697319 RepID=UPI0013D62E90|nr:hypothetical protein [Pseudooceanicola aestuarii]
MPDRMRENQAWHRLGLARPGALGLLLGSCLATAITGQEQTAEPPFAPPGVAYVNTAVLATPDAREIFVDIPSALAWARYQRGTLGRWSYVFYPDGTAKLMDDADRARVRARLTCVAGAACRVATAEGRVMEVPVGTGARPDLPEDGALDSAARFLAQWLLAGTAPPPPPPAPAPPSLPERPAAPLVESVSPPPQSPDAPGPPATAPIGPAAVGLRAPQAVADPVCSETAPFLPSACAQPTEPLALPPVRPAPAARPGAPASRVAAAPPAPTAEAVAVNTPEEAETLFDRYKVNCSLTGTTSLAFLHPDAAERGPAKPRVSLGCSARFSERLSMRLSLIGYLTPEDQAASDPDYSYAFTYRISDRLSLGYSNYTARFSGVDGGVNGLLDGDLRASYKLPPLRLPNDTNVVCNASIGLPLPAENSMNLSCGYAVTKRFRIGGTTYFYMPGQQDTYQPDFSYTASYRFNDDWLLSYNNYSNNRWPWNRGKDPGRGFTDGSLSLTYKLTF